MKAFVLFGLVLCRDRHRSRGRKRTKSNENWHVDLLGIVFCVALGWVAVFSSCLKKYYRKSKWQGPDLWGVPLELKLLDDWGHLRETRRSWQKIWTDQCTPIDNGRRSCQLGRQGWRSVESSATADWSVKNHANLRSHYDDVIGQSRPANRYCPHQELRDIVFSTPEPCPSVELSRQFQGILVVFWRSPLREDHLQTGQYVSLSGESVETAPRIYFSRMRWTQWLSVSVSRLGSEYNMH